MYDNVQGVAGSREKSIRLIHSDGETLHKAKKYFNENGFTIINANIAYAVEEAIMKCSGDIWDGFIKEVL